MKNCVGSIFNCMIDGPCRRTQGKIIFNQIMSVVLFYIKMTVMMSYSPHKGCEIIGLASDEGDFCEFRCLGTK